MEEISGKLYLKNKEQKLDIMQIKDLLAQTTKRNFIDFLNGQITYNQFKRNVYQQCAEQRGETLHYTVLDDLRGHLDPKFLGKLKADDLLLHKYV